VGDWVMLCTQPREQGLKHCHVGLGSSNLRGLHMVHMVLAVPSRGFTSSISASPCHVAACMHAGQHHHNLLGVLLRKNMLVQCDTASPGAAAITSSMSDLAAVPADSCMHTWGC
jgi:hypothetical protein